MLMRSDPAADPDEAPRHEWSRGWWRDLWIGEVRNEEPTPLEPAWEMGKVEHEYEVLTGVIYPWCSSFLHQPSQLGPQSAPSIEPRRPCPTFLHRNQRQEDLFSRSSTSASVSADACPPGNGIKRNSVIATHALRMLSCTCATCHSGRLKMALSHTASQLRRNVALS